MSEISASDAGLIGFRLARENRGAVIAWSIVGIVFTLISSLLVAHFVGPAMAELADRNPFQRMTPAELSELGEKFSGFGPAMLVLFPVIVIVSGLLNASANRIVLTPQDSGGSALRFGPVEVRQMIVVLIQTLVETGVVMGGVVASTLVASVVALAAGALAALVIFLGFFATLGAYIYVKVRLSLLASLTFETGRIDLRQAWRLTARRFGPMLGAYAIAIVMAMIVNLLGGAIFMAIAAIGFGTAAPNPTSVAEVFTPFHLIYVAFSGVLWALMQLIVLGTGPSLYKQIQGATPAA